MSKKYYKVVLIENGKLYSAVQGNVEYKENEWVSAPGDTRLFVFDDKADAFNFIYRRQHLIFECKVVGGIKLSGTRSERDVPYFWRIFNKLIQTKRKFCPAEFKLTFPGAVSALPAVLVKKVKLTRLIS
jgi:hypothetical protein